MLNLYIQKYQYLNRLQAHWFINLRPPAWLCGPSAPARPLAVSLYRAPLPRPRSQLDPTWRAWLSAPDARVWAPPAVQALPAWWGAGVMLQAAAVSVPVHGWPASVWAVYEGL